MYYDDISMKDDKLSLCNYGGVDVVNWIDSQLLYVTVFK